MLQTFGPSLVSSLTLTFVFGYLFLRDREPYLGIWAAAWAFWVVRYSYGLASGNASLMPAAIVLPLLVLARATFMLWGSMSFSGRALPRAWLALIAADLTLVLWEGSNGASLVIAGVTGVTHYALFTIGLVWSGVLFLQNEETRGFEKHLAGVSLIVLGLLQVTFPFRGTLPEWWSTGGVGFLVGHALQIAVAVGVLLVSLRRAKVESERLHVRLSGTLTQALSGHIPICAHCKSIRDEDDGWLSLETYVGRRTQAALSHGICPSCVQEHYGKSPAGRSS